MRQHAAPELLSVVSFLNRKKEYLKAPEEAPRPHPHQLLHWHQTSATGMEVWGHTVILRLAVPGRRGWARQRAKQQQELPVLGWRSFWARLGPTSPYEDRRDAGTFLQLLLPCSCFLGSLFLPLWPRCSHSPWERRWQDTGSVQSLCAAAHPALGSANLGMARTRPCPWAEPGPSSLPSPPQLHLWHVNISLCTQKLKLIPGAAASQQSPSAT